MTKTADVNIHSKSRKRVNNIHSSSDSNLKMKTVSILTPTKRKLVQNCNTGNLLKIFEAKCGHPNWQGSDGGGQS